MPMTPKAGEGPHEFFKRCMAAQNSKGLEALEACALAWDRAHLGKDGSVNQVTLAGGPVEFFAGEEGKPDRFAMTAYTGATVSRWFGDMILDLSGMSLANPRVAALREHDPLLVAGFVDGARITKAGFLAEGQLSRATGTGKEIKELMDENHPLQVSVGISCVRREELEAGNTTEVNGRTIAGPCLIWRECLVDEISFVSCGADRKTAAVPMGKDTTKEDDMPLKNAPGKTKAGTTPGPVAETAPQELSKTGQAEQAEAGTSPQELSQPAPTAPENGAAEFSQSQDSILAMCESAGLSLADSRQILGKFRSVEKAAVEILALSTARNAPLNSGHVEMGVDERDKVRLAASDGLALRMGISMDTTAPGAQEFRGMSLMSIARELLSRAGERHDRMRDRDVVKLALATSDLPVILTEASRRRLLASYQEAETTWQLWCNVTDASDFKPISAVALSAAPELDKIPEGGEYKDGHFTELASSYRIGKYGKIVTFTLESIKNDDLRALERVPRAFGFSANRLVNSLAYGLLLNNVKMADGTVLFHANHKNLGAAMAFGPDGMKAGRLAMRKQTGMAGETLNLAPSFALLPAALEHDAQVLLASVALPEADKSSGVINPYGPGKPSTVTPVVDATLDNTSATAWYLAANPALVDTVEVAFLDGVQVPEVEEFTDPRRDGLSMKFRYCVGVGCLDWRGLWKTPGA